jgi:hypothetical protein
MKRNDIFTFTAPNGVEVKGVCLYPVFQGSAVTTYVCYAQNRLFTMREEFTMTDHGAEITMKYQEVIAEYAAIPEYDELLVSDELNNSLH